jgi:hypothetical protein
MADRRTGRRTFAAVAGAGVGCAALASLAGARPWVDVAPAMRTLGAEATASTLEPYAQSAPALALALVTLAAWGVLLVLRGRARTVMAVVGLAFAVGLLVVTVLGHGQVPDAVRQAMTESLGTRPAAAARLPLPHTGWYWLALLAALGDAVTLAVAVRQAHRWPAMGSRYAAPGHAPTTGPASEQDMWRSLDQGHDPTDPGSA